MPSEQQPTVYLLRSGSEPDPYVEALERIGCKAVCVPVLAFAFPHQPALLHRLRTPGAYSGLIVTSPRAGQALRAAFEQAPDLRAAWREKRVYAVGPRTAHELQTLGFRPEGQESGDAGSLASVIAKKKTFQSLLFLCGNRRRDDLPDALNVANVRFEELVAYETAVRDDIFLPSAQPGDWLVFFSPSGIEAVNRTSGIDPRAFHLAAIGATTGAALNAAGLHVEAVAEIPTPEGIRDAIKSAPPFPKE